MHKSRPSALYSLTVPCTTQHTHTPHSRANSGILPMSSLIGRIVFLQVCIEASAFSSTKTTHISNAWQEEVSKFVSGHHQVLWSNDTQLPLDGGTAHKISNKCVCCSYTQLMWNKMTMSKCKMKTLLCVLNIIIEGFYTVMYINFTSIAKCRFLRMLLWAHLYITTLTRIVSNFKLLGECSHTHQQEHSASCNCYSLRSYGPCWLREGHLSCLFSLSRSLKLSLLFITPYTPLLFILISCQPEVSRTKRCINNEWVAGDKMNVIIRNLRSVQFIKVRRLFSCKHLHEDKH